MPQGHVYILGSTTGTLYIGVTSRFNQRLLEHKIRHQVQFRHEIQLPSPPPPRNLRGHPPGDLPRKTAQRLDPSQENSPDHPTQPHLQRPGRTAGLAHPPPLRKRRRPTLNSNSALAVTQSARGPLNVSSPVSVSAVTQSARAPLNAPSPVSVFAVILSEAKDPEELRQPRPPEPFSHTSNVNLNQSQLAQSPFQLSILRTSAPIQKYKRLSQAPA